MLKKKSDLLIFNSTHQKNKVTVVGKFENSVLKLSVARCGKNEAYKAEKGIALAKDRLNHGCHAAVIPINDNATKNRNLFVKLASPLADVFNKSGNLICSVNQ